MIFYFNNCLIKFADRMKKTPVFSLLLLMPVLLLCFCDTDPGLEPTQSGFKGKITFKKQWPENTDQVLVVAATKFPPSNISEIVLGDPLPLGIDSTEYIIYTPPADFAAVGVVWKEKDQPWDVTNIIGIYFPGADQFNPGSVTIPDKKTIIDQINITADLSKARRAVNSAIKGKIRAYGAWPKGAATVLLAASTSFPPDSLLNITFSSPITAGFDSTTYAMSLQPGKYKMIGALVMVEGEPIGFSSLKGFYSVYNEALQNWIMKGVTIESDTAVLNNIDIRIVF